MTSNKLTRLDPAHIDGWMPVLVPTEDYVATANFVAARVAERVGKGPSAGGARSSSTGPDPRLAAWPAWPESALSRLAKSESVTAQRWTAAMDAIASDDGDWFTTTEVASMSGLTINEWRDAPRKISRHLKAHYSDVPQHDGELAWPLRAWTNPDKRDEVSWGMAPLTKERWLRVRGSGGQ